MDLVSELLFTAAAPDVSHDARGTSVTVRLHVGLTFRCLLTFRMGRKSSHYILVHSPAHRGKDDRYPPWLATIWSLMERVREAKTLWNTVLDPVQETLKKSTTSEAAAKRMKAALDALESLPWDGAVKGFRGGVFVNDLASWFTRDWLKTDHEDQMLELLVSDLGISDGSTTCIQPTYFVRGLAQAYSDPESYRTARRFGWLRKLGASFAMKDCTRLGSKANKSEDHWKVLFGLPTVFILRRGMRYTSLSFITTMPLHPSSLSPAPQHPGTCPHLPELHPSRTMLPIQCHLSPNALAAPPDARLPTYHLSLSTSKGPPHVLARFEIKFES
ncbi:hypothetical protein B0H13DRAFT_2352669 [Mycena leptocephala]|nr:hypothetical protein B0H13DRAFT_2352669 [Mycena leptocephala]